MAYKKIVIKIGSQLLASKDGIDEKFIDSLARQIKSLREEGVKVVLVSSGAVLAGIKKLGIKKRKFTITEKQAIAAVGQAYLIQIYDKIFSKYGLTIGQILLTTDGLKIRKRYNYARNTIEKSLEWGVVPIINENDSVAVEEIVFGDNDFLAAHVAVLINADLLIILSSAGGLYTSDPNDEKAELIKEIKDIEEALQFAGSSKSEFGTGGMRSKLEAAKIATSQGIPVIIAPKKDEVITSLLEDDKSIGTYIHPQEKKYKGKKSWLALLSEAKGKIRIDQGAKKAIRAGKSLLPAGIITVEGLFSKGEVVAIEDENGKILGKGIVEYGSEELNSIKGKSNCKEAIHADNIVVLK